MSRAPDASASEHAAERRQLLDAVLAAPDDDGPRLVYSDWLQAHGDPRGEFIAVQYEIRRLADGAAEERLLELRQRELQLLKQHRLTWTGTLFGRRARTCRFERGFVGHVLMSTRDVADMGERIFEAEPVSSVHLMDPAVQRLQECAAAPKLRAIGWNDLAVGDQGVREFARATTFTGLERLTLVRCGISGRGASAIAEISELGRFPELRVLSLANNLLGDDGAAALARAPLLGNLQELHLGRNHIGIRGALALASSPYLTGIKRLLVWMNPLGVAGLAALRERYGARVEADVS